MTADTRQDDSAAHAREGRARLVWTGVIVGLLGMSIAIHGVLLYVATSDPSFAVEEDYEARAADWDGERARQAASDRLGWSADTTLRPGRARQTAELVVTLRGADEAPIEDVALTARLFHNARAADVVETILEHRGGGVYEAIVPARRAGVWIVDLAGARNDDRWAERERRMLSSVSGSDSVGTPISPGDAP